MNPEMMARGRELINSTQIKLEPFNEDLYLIWNRYDLDCLTLFLSQYGTLSTEFTNPKDPNWQLLKHRPVNEAGSSIIWLPIMERMHIGEIMSGIMARVQVYITDVCIDACKVAGYDPTKGSVMFNHLVSKAFFDVSLKLGTYLGNARLVYATSNQRYFMQALSEQQWNDVSQLSGLALHSAARTMHQQIQHGQVEHVQQGWSATSYLT